MPEGPFQDELDGVVQDNTPMAWALWIVQDASLSNEVDLGAYVLCGIMIPAAWTSASLTYLNRTHGTAAAPVQDSAGAEIEHTPAAGTYMAVDPADFAGVRFLTLRSGTAAAPVTQDDAVGLTLVVRPV